MIKPSKNILVLVSLLGFLTLYGLQTTFASIGQPPEQTVPTRTPRPAANPTEPPKKDNNNNNSNNNNSNNNNNNNNPPPPTQTPEAPPTATAIPVTIAPTPIGGIIQPDRCGDPFFVATLGSVNVRSHPATDSDIVTKMVYLEARQVLARAADVQWWQILLPDTSTGWVFNATGSMIGRMDNVPIINPDGSIQTEVTWQPTPDLFCPTLVPSPTPSATTPPTETPTALPTETEAPTALPTETETPQPEPTEASVAIALSNDEDPGSGIISPLPEEDNSSKTTSTEPESSDIIPLPITTDNVSTTNTDTDSLTGSTMNWPIMIGLATILLGLGGLFFQRRQGNKQDTITT